jgi:hypothetical protein
MSAVKAAVRDVVAMAERREIALPPHAQVWSLGLLLLTLASANLYTAVTIALRPNQSQDLRLVLKWSRDALHGVNPYEGPNSDADYPPHALLIAAPLTLLDTQKAVALWLVLQCSLTIVLAIASVRLWPLPSAVEQVLVVLCIVCWNSVRVGLGNGQLTVLAMVFGLVAAHMQTKRVVPIGILVGAACMKPHIGIAFVIWLLLQRRFKEIVIAGLTVCGATVLVSFWMQRNPILLASDFVVVLLRMFGGPVAATEGALELRPLIGYFLTNAVIAMAAYLSVLASLAWVIVRRALRRPPIASVEALVLGCSLTLVFVFHNVYDLVLLAPLFAGCAMARIPRIRPGVLAAMTTIWALVMVVDVPGLVWKLNGRVATTSPWMHFDRALVFLLLLLAIFIATSSQRASSLRLAVDSLHPRAEAS